jgi:hypothetical protein
MLIERRSPRTGHTNTRDVDCTPEEFRAWANGALIQKAMPRASADDREFVLTGYTPEDWAAIFPPEEGDK